jgi:hypothetical protein
MAQQVIGSFPTMDGGFEGQAASGAITTTSYANGYQSSVWTTSSSGMGTFQTATPRTGGKYVNVNYTSTTKRLQSPTPAAGAIVGGTSYTVQFYYRTAGATAPGGTLNQVSTSSDGTNPTGGMSYTALTALTGTSGAWTKVTGTNTAANSTNPSPKYGYLCAWRTSTAMAAAMDIDDVVMYAGAVDVTAADPVTSPNQAAVAATQQTIAWTAPGTGVDGGGYMIVRGLTDPATTPNVNGIYKIGNTVAVGEQVVYLGTSTSFVDLGLTPSTTYYYRIYTVDKAFNYSTAATLTAATTTPSFAAEPTVQVTNISFANVTSTGFDINWTAGDGTNSLVVVRAGSAVDDNPTDGGTYAPNTVYGSGTQIGTGNYSVYNGTGSTLTITGLSKATKYYVKVYSYNGASGSENYLITGAASANQLAAPGEIVSNGTSPVGAPKSYSDGTAWVGGVAPGQYDNATIKSGDFLNVGSTQKCYNLTIESGAKLYANTAQSIQIYGTSFLCDGTFGDISTVLPANGGTGSALTTEFGGNLIISGSSTSNYPYKIRPITGSSNIGVTFDANTEITYGTVGLQYDNTGNDNVTYTINAGKTVRVYGSFSTTSSQTGVGTGNTFLNVYGTLNVGNTFNTTVASGKAYTVTIYDGGLLSTATLSNTKNFYLSPAHAVQAATAIAVNAGGEIRVNGILDCSNASYLSTITGGGTFSTVSGATVILSNASGINATTGPIRTATRTFDAGTNYQFVGTSAQVAGSDLPASVSRLTVNNAAGVSLSNPTTVTSTLTLTAGKLSLGANNLTAAAISGASATNYIVTDGAGQLTQSVAAATAKSFPIGASATSYDPVSVTPTDATDFSVKVGTTLSGSAASNYTYNSLEWDLASTVPSSTVISLTPSVITATGIHGVIDHYVGGEYLHKYATLVGNTYTATFNTFSPFVTGGTDIPTEINNISNGISAYTVGNVLNVKGLNAGDVVNVYSVNGQKVCHQIALSNIMSTTLQKGAYVINVKTADEVKTIKTCIK